MNIEHENQPTIFLIEEDDDARTVLRQNLKRYGYHVIVALDEEDAMERVGDGNVQAELILMNLTGKSPEDVLKIGRHIRKHAKYDGHTPLVVMSEKYDENLDGTDVKAGEHDWITYLEDADQLRNLLARLTEKV